MIKGNVTLEDTSIQFELNHKTGLVEYTVSNDFNHETETKLVDGSAFFSALAIAVHNDGMPDFNKDYPNAESVQPVNPELRWIP